jgi:carboxyl-terminal processing protease
VNVDEETGRLKVIAPMVGTPAYEAGVLAGDLIMEVEGKTTEGMSLDQAVEVLQGRPGTAVALKVLHPGTKDPVDLKMARAIIDVPTVLADHRKPDDKPDYIFNKDDKVGYIRITNFNQRTPEELTKVLDELKAEGMLGLILDLRDNPGGLLSAAVAVSDLFIEEGDIVTTKGRNVEDKSYKATKSGTYAGFPMAVLVNGNSASASEIVSACLQDHKRAVVIGSRSFGKGSVQNIMELEDGESVLKLTVATYWRPSGKNIHRFEDAKETDEWGVSPDPNFEVTLSPKEYRDWATARRDRDLLSKANKPVEAEKPLDDKVLAKAVAYIHDEEGKAKGEKPEKAKEAEKEPEKKAAE